MRNKKLKAFIEKHERLNYVLHVLRYSKNKAYRKAVVDIGKEKEDFFHIEQLGEKNKGRIVYLYDLDNAVEIGFFAAYRYMIEICYLCELYGFTPVFAWGENFPYSEKNKEINGTTIPYEQFFLQPADLAYTDALESFAVIRSTDWQRNKARTFLFDGKKVLGYCVDENYYRRMAIYSEKYIHLNPLLANQMKKDIERILGEKKTVAVHVRIKVFQQAINNHPIPAEISEYIKCAQEALEHGFEQIFLATEESETLEEFKNIFGDKVVFYEDVLRAEEANTIYAENCRENHKYLLGYEVLRDMHTMARCDGLIAGLSQVSFCAQITKHERAECFEYKHIFDKGVHSSNYSVFDDYIVFKKKKR